MLDVAIGTGIVMLVVAVWAGTLKLAAWLADRSIEGERRKKCM